MLSDQRRELDRCQHLSTAARHTQSTAWRAARISCLPHSAAAVLWWGHEYHPRRNRWTPPRPYSLHSARTCRLSFASRHQTLRCRVWRALEQPHRLEQRFAHCVCALVACACPPAPRPHRCHRRALLVCVDGEAGLHDAELPARYPHPRSPPQMMCRTHHHNYCPHTRIRGPCGAPS